MVLCVDIVSNNVSWCIQTQTVDSDVSWLTQLYPGAHVLSHVASVIFTLIGLL